MQGNEAFITIKDQKEGFPYHVSCRLLNPSKTTISIIRKLLLDNINYAILSSTKINQWRIHLSLLHGFSKSHANKLHQLYVLMWKISINLSPVIYLKNRLNLKLNKTVHPDFWWWFINHYAGQKNILFDGTTHWIKKGGDEDFDVPMGCFDGAEICELVGTYRVNMTNMMNKEYVAIYLMMVLVFLKTYQGLK